MKIRNDSINNQGVNKLVEWLKDKGYGGQEFGQALAAINASRERGRIAEVIFKDLFGMSQGEIDGWGIG